MHEGQRGKARKEIPLKRHPVMKLARNLALGKFPGSNKDDPS